MVAGPQTVAATSSHCSLTPQPVAEARRVELSHYNLCSYNDETKKPGRYPSARPYRGGTSPTYVDAGIWVDGGMELGF